MADQDFGFCQQSVISVKVEVAESEDQTIYMGQPGLLFTTQPDSIQQHHGDNDTKVRLPVIGDHGYGTGEALTSQEITPAPLNDTVSAVAQRGLPDRTDGRVHVIPNYSTMTLQDDTVPLSLAEETVVETNEVAFELPSEVVHIPGHQHSVAKKNRRAAKRKTSETGKPNISQEEFPGGSDITGTCEPDAEFKGNRKCRIPSITPKKATFASASSAAEHSMGKRVVSPCRKLSGDLSDDVAKIACVREEAALRRSTRRSKKKEAAQMTREKSRKCKDDRPETKTQDMVSTSRAKQAATGISQVRKTSPRHKSVIVERITTSKLLRRRHIHTQEQCSTGESADGETESTGKKIGGKKVVSKRSSINTSILPRKTSRKTLKRNATNEREENSLCPVCFKSYVRRHHMKRHMATHLPMKPFSCTTCGKQFTRRQQLLIHEETHQECREYEHQCTVCGKEFWKKVYLQKHMKTHSSERPFKCELCGKDFVLAWELKNHGRIHTGEKPYACQECGMTFTHNQGLLRHKRTHTGEKPYECQTCGKRFTENKGLVFHTRIHTGERPYVCEECGKGFPRLYALKKHMVKHTGVKAFLCPICDKGFSQSTNMKTHMKIHTNEKSFECPACDKKFLRKSDMKKHINVHFRRQYDRKGKTKTRQGRTTVSSSTNPGARGSQRLSKDVRKKLIDCIVNGSVSVLWKGNGDLNISPALMTTLYALPAATDDHKGEMSDEQSSSAEQTSEEDDDDREGGESGEQYDDMDDEDDVKNTNESNVFVVDTASCGLRVKAELHSSKPGSGYLSYSRETGDHDDPETGDVDKSTDNIPVNEVEVLTSPHIPVPTAAFGNVGGFERDTFA